MNKILLFIAPLLLMLASCAKHIDIRNQTLSKHNWKLTEYTVDGSSVLQDCQKDDIYYFYGTMTGKVDEGSNICDSTLVTGSQGTDSMVAMHEIDFEWSVTGDQRNIYIKHFGDPNYNPEWAILDMDDHSFHIKGIDKQSGVTITYYKTFVAVNNL